LKEEKQEKQDLKRKKKYERQDLKRTTKKVKRLLHSKMGELDNRESQLFLKFLATQPEPVLKLDAVELVWTFIMFLKTSGYRVLHGNTIFCMPLARLVKMKDLK